MFIKKKTIRKYYFLFKNKRDFSKKKGKKDLIFKLLFFKNFKCKKTNFYSILNTIENCPISALHILCSYADNLKEHVRHGAQSSTEIRLRIGYLVPKNLLIQFVEWNFWLKFCNTYETSYLLKFPNPEEYFKISFTQISVLSEFLVCSSLRR